MKCILFYPIVETTTNSVKQGEALNAYGGTLLCHHIVNDDKLLVWFL